MVDAFVLVGLTSLDQDVKLSALGLRVLVKQKLVAPSEVRVSPEIIKTVIYSLSTYGDNHTTHIWTSDAVRALIGGHSSRGKPPGEYRCRERRHPVQWHCSRA